MKRVIVGAIVGAFIVFAWQAVSHMFMNHHDAAYRKVENQDAAMSALSSIFKEEGQYMIPNAGNDASHEEMEKANAAMEGKPWAQVIYHTAWKSDMTMAMVRSFATAFLCVLIFILILGKAPGTFASIFFKGLGIGFFSFLFIWYNGNIWMQIPWDVIQGELIDLLVAWGLCGLWLGWWLNRKKTLS